MYSLCLQADSMHMWFFSLPLDVKKSFYSTKKSVLSRSAGGFRSSHQPCVSCNWPPYWLWCQASSKERSPFSRWTWKQPSDVKLCACVILRSEGQTSSEMTTRFVRRALEMQANLNTHFTKWKCLFCIFFPSLCHSSRIICFQWKKKSIRGIYRYGKNSTCESWHKQVDFQRFGWDIMGATGKCVSSVSHTLKLPPTSLKIKLRHHWLSLTSTSKDPGCDCEIPGFPSNGWRRHSAKIPQRAEGGGRADDTIQSEAWKHHWIYSICRKPLLQPRIRKARA